MNHRILPAILVAAGLLAADPPVPTPVMTPETAQPLRTVRGTRVARVAGAAPEWDAQVRQSASWDSNALLDSDPDTVTSATAVYTTDATLGWRPVADERDFLKASLNVGYDRRPQLEDLDTSRLGLALIYAHQGESLTSGANLGLTRHWLDGKGAAAELRGGYSLVKLRADSADLASIELGAVHFDSTLDRPDRLQTLGSLGSADDRSGVLTALGYRHWWVLPQGGRVEAGVRAGRYFAQSDLETYDLLQPFASFRLRPTGWDLQARAGLEGRAYAGAAPGSTDERSDTASLAASADRRLGHGLWLGAFAALAARDSSLDGRDYQRWQVGLRLIWAYAPVEE